jgi:hypothetical protein
VAERDPGGSYGGSMPAPDYSHVPGQTSKRRHSRYRSSAEPPQDRSPRRAPAANARRSAYKKSWLASISSLVGGFLLIAALLAGWLESDEGHLTPKNGTGYALGIVGATALLLLLFYPLRKRLRMLRGFGSVSGWFRAHMMLGLIGPALILFHSNFKLGSLNSNVALASMLTVAASGLIGRHLYKQVHLGLSGRRMQIHEILADIEGLKHAIGGDLALFDDVRAKLDAYATHAISDRSGALTRLVAVLALRAGSARRRKRLESEVARALAVEGRSRKWTRKTMRKRATEIRKLLRLYFAAVNKAATFAFYERLLSLWHVLHLPLFFLLILTAVVHVIAVHLY